jgi:hypothetical protein
MKCSFSIEIQAGWGCLITCLACLPTGRLEKKVIAVRLRRTKAISLTLRPGWPFIPHVRDETISKEGQNCQLLFFLLRPRGLSFLLTEKKQKVKPACRQQAACSLVPEHAR